MKEKLKNGTLNLKGKKIGHLQVVGRPHYRKPVEWICVCTATTFDGKRCGKEVQVLHSRLIHARNPKTHCGCQLQSLQSVYKKEYHAWHNMIERCHNPKHHGYVRYGAKGVYVCQEWRDSFEQFFKDVGPCPKGMSLDRIDPRGPYAPEFNGKKQIRWATDQEQARNKKDTKWVKHPKTGKPVRAADLADELGLTYQTLRNRMLEEGTW